MSKTTSIAIVTYNGIDGACAAAVGLHRFPEARVLVTSAKRIAGTLEELARTACREVHVCGVGVYCDWADVAGAAAALKRRNTRLIWHCGRGYLEPQAEAFAQFAEPDFRETGTNTAGMAEALGVAGQLDVQGLCELAWFDHNVAGGRPPEERSDEQSFMADLIMASMGHYFKYQDEKPYLETIQRLSQLELGLREKTLVDAYRRNRYKYLLHGRTPAVTQLKERIQKCADANRHVLITGESGVGKEHVANLLWERSRRAMGPLVAVNCALYAGSAHLANSDLFGHKKGAFTGADSAREGRFLTADGGILFLDEVAELPMEVQAKLLRVLEDGKIMPVGADQYEHQADVCIVAATNAHLPALVREQKFRPDLYHRLSTLCIRVPPLRERQADIPELMEQRLEVLREEGHTRSFSEEEMRALTQYPWPGNVRQLMKVVDRVVLLGQPVEDVLAEEQAFGFDTASAPDEMLPRNRDDVETLDAVNRRYARRAWELFGQNYTAAAGALGVATNTLRYTLLGQKKEQEREKG